MLKYIYSIDPMRSLSKIDKRLREALQRTEGDNGVLDLEIFLRAIHTTCSNNSPQVPSSISFASTPYILDCNDLNKWMILPFSDPFMRYLAHGICTYNNIKRKSLTMPGGSRALLVRCGGAGEESDISLPLLHEVIKLSYS